MKTPAPRVRRHHERLPEEQAEGLARAVAGLVVVCQEAEGPRPGSEVVSRGLEALEARDGRAGSSSFVSS